MRKGKLFKLTDSTLGCNLIDKNLSREKTPLYWIDKNTIFMVLDPAPDTWLLRTHHIDIGWLVLIDKTIILLEINGIRMLDITPLEKK